MKNSLLLLSMLFTLLFAGNNLNAQDCAILGAKVSADTNCVFTTWNPDLVNFARNNVNSITVNGEVFYNNDSTGAWGVDVIRYSRQFPGDNPDTDSLANCDTAGSTDLFGEISYNVFGLDTCQFQGGSAVPVCPDNVLVSRGSNCLILEYPEGFISTPPDSVTLGDSVFYSQGYNPSHPNTILYLIDSAVVCDTADMKVLLNDTLFLGEKVCTYANGLLPIVILAFDYSSHDDQVDLAWKVNSDEPAQKLYLQKSYDGVEWVNIHDQLMAAPGSGFSTSGNYSDLSVDQSRVYYRLFIEGFHGKGNYSNLLPVTMKDQLINSVFYQPQSRSIMVRAGKNFTGDMYLFNTRGQNIMTHNVTLPRGGYVEVQVDGALPAGIYFVRFEDSQIPPTKLFIQ